MAYVPLHVHSVYSHYESMMTIKEIVARASYLGFRALALTDHWSTYGHHELAGLAKQAGIKPIFGAEIQHSSLTGSGGLYHLTILAEGDIGYRNLVALVTRHSMKEKEPHVTPEELSELRGGLIVLTGCLKGEASQSILHGTLGRARNVVDALVDIFGRSNVFIEILNHDTQEEMLVMDQMKTISGKVGIPPVATNNDRYLLKEDAGHFKVLKSLNKKQLDWKKGGDSQEYYFKKERELLPFFYSEREPLDCSGEIAERCTFDLGLSGRIQFSTAGNPDESLGNMCQRRFLLKFHNRPHDERSYLKRMMTREVEIARAQGLSDFLIFLHRLFLSAGKRNVWLELLGSELLNSIVAHILEIVPLNPIDHDLVFESFSPRQGVPPFIELISSESRKEVFLEILGALLPEYQPRYQMAEEEMSLATIVKEIGESLGAPQELREAMARILTYEKRHRTLSALLEDSPALQNVYTTEPLAKDILHFAFALQGKLLHLTQDSSRIVIVPPPLEDFISCAYGENGECFAQVSTSAVEGMSGWILRVQHSHFLSALARAVEDMRRAEGRGSAPSLFKTSESGKWTPEALDDPVTFGLISTGETTGVYLLESQGIRDHLLKIKPTSFGELVNVISLYRPGPMEGRLWERYLENAEKKGKVYLPHPSLASALQSTRGILLYKEQIREILEQTAGLRGGRAIAVENALRARDAGELMNARLDYIRGAMDAGINEEDAQKTFDFLLHNVGFTHSKALSVAQAYLSYRTAYLKAHAFERYFLALLNSNLDVRERQEKYLAYLGSKGTAILPPSVNASGAEYCLEDGGVRAPLQSIGSLDRLELQAVLSERARGGVFSSFNAFLERMNGKISHEAVTSLIDVGVWSEGGDDREKLKKIANTFFLSSMTQGFIPPPAPKMPLARKKRDRKRQMTLFDGEGGDTGRRERG